MPLDGEEHARAEHENLERKEDYRNPIHDFEYFQTMTWRYLPGLMGATGRVAPCERRTRNHSQGEPSNP